MCCRKRYEALLISVRFVYDASPFCSRNPLDTDCDACTSKIQLDRNNTVTIVENGFA